MVNDNKNFIVKKVLKNELGWSWFIFLSQCSLLSKFLFKRSKWGKLKNAESNFIKPYAVVAMLYIKFKKKLGIKKAFNAMRNIIVPIGCNQQNVLVNSINITDDEPMKRLIAFNNLMDIKGATQFNDRLYVKKTNNICHFKIRRCIYKDFFESVGTPELTQLFCEVDKNFFPKAFPKFKVHRGSSWENTLAFGKKECDFIFEKINTNNKRI